MSCTVRLMPGSTASLWAQLQDCNCSCTAEGKKKSTIQAVPNFLWYVNLLITVWKALGDFFLDFRQNSSFVRTSLLDRVAVIKNSLATHDGKSKCGGQLLDCLLVRETSLCLGVLYGSLQTVQQGICKKQLCKFSYWRILNWWMIADCKCVCKNLVFWCMCMHCTLVLSTQNLF